MSTGSSESTIPDTEPHHDQPDSFWSQNNENKVNLHSVSQKAISSNFSAFSFLGTALRTVITGMSVCVCSVCVYRAGLAAQIKPEAKPLAESCGCRVMSLHRQMLKAI